MDKDHILQEIRRTTSANGGAPLGSARFESETGIKVADWFGRYWARWGDALREAGFTPNQLQTGYEKEELLEAYARLALELGRLPVRGDLRLKRTADPKFPSWNTFERLGAKADLIRHLIEYCQAHQEYGDVLRWCEEYPKADKEAPTDPGSGKEEIGFVYLIKSGRFYKIGKTNAAGRREYELAIQLPERATKVHVIRTDDPTGIEAYWHKRFEPKRKNGEWFELAASDVRAFKRRKFM
jgi:hypothetical protein